MTPKQQRFVEVYLVDLNASAAARRAGYSSKRADAIGHENLGKPEISSAIAAAQAARAQRTQIDADWVLRRLAALADADVADLYGPDGGLKPATEWPEVWRKTLIQGLKTVTVGNTEVGFGQVTEAKLADRLKVLELIGRHVTVGVWRDKLEHVGPDGGPLQAVSRIEIVAKALPADGNRNR